MKLQHLRVEQFRQFRHAVELGNLQPGINLIHGPNESGKSTLVRAIRAAFFERYRSKSAEDLAPWGIPQRHPPFNWYLNTVARTGNWTSAFSNDIAVTC